MSTNNNPADVAKDGYEALIPLTKISDGYSMFNKKEDNCVKVVLDPWAA